MIVFKKAADLIAYLTSKKAEGEIIHFVPTMGALHQGHQSLVSLAKKASGITVCSIFVNPTQFNDTKDFEKYPITIAEDIEALDEVGCDVLFLPSVDEIYPKGTKQQATFDFGYLETVLEGAHRPGHFKGVGQVVARLLEIVAPDKMYLGQKDYQQCMVLKKLLELIGKKETIQIITAPTIREADGLAMSSRNRRLSIPQRTLAGLLYQCLISIQAKQHNESFDIVKKECLDLLKSKNLEPEYIALVHADTLEILHEFDAAIPMVALIASKVGEVRLIDNLLLNP